MPIDEPDHPETTGPDGDVLVHVRKGCLVHVAEGTATYLSRGESVRLAREVLAGDGGAAPGPPEPSPEEMLRSYCEHSPCVHPTFEAGVAAERARVSAEVVALRRTLERWVHGQQIEGDYVCPDSLRMTEAERKLEEARAVLAPLVAQYHGCSLGNDLTKALSALTRATP